MTEEQKKAIDACKDQAAQKEGFENWLKAQDEYYTERDVTSLEHTMDRAMKLYGEQCRKEGAYEAISVISDAISDFDEMAPRYDKKRVADVHDFLADSFDKLTAQA
jgi:hypothetical protein